MSVIFLLHLGVTLLLTGVIWLVQLETYPGFLALDSERFPDYHRFHCRRIGWVVIPLMLLELTTALWLLVGERASLPVVWQSPALVLLILVWGSTFLVQVPCHNRLSKGFTEVAARRLIQTNWVRTLAWTGRSLLLLIYLYLG